MRSRSFRLFWLSLVLVSVLALPGSAAPRDRDGDAPVIEKIVRTVKHVVATILGDDLSIPKP